MQKHIQLNREPVNRLFNQLGGQIHDKIQSSTVFSIIYFKLWDNLRSQLSNCIMENIEL